MTPPLPLSELLGHQDDTAHSAEQHRRGGGDDGANSSLSSSIARRDDPAAAHDAGEALDEEVARHPQKIPRTNNDGASLDESGEILDEEIAGAAQFHAHQQQQQHPANHQQTEQQRRLSYHRRQQNNPSTTSSLTRLDNFELPYSIYGAAGGDTNSARLSRRSSTATMSPAAGSSRNGTGQQPQRNELIRLPSDVVVVTASSAAAAAAVGIGATADVQQPARRVSPTVVGRIAPPPQLLNLALLPRGSPSSSTIKGGEASGVGSNSKRAPPPAGESGRWKR